MIEKTIHYIRLLNFLDESLLDNNEMNLIVEYLQSNTFTLSRETILYKNNDMSAELVKNKLIKVARLRKENEDFNINGNTLEHIKKKKNFKFDHVFRSENNENIYAELNKFIEQSRRYNNDICFMLNGYSGSGKTYTMIGDDENGLLNHILRDYGGYNSKALLYEIYMNDIYLYLNGRKIKYMENVYDPENYFDLDPMTINKIITKFRRSNQNNVHDNSSRSHLVLDVKFYDGENFIHKITFFDLAGNEKYNSKDKNTLEETKYINKSLFNVYEYIKAFEKNKKYNNNKCKLTQAISQYTNIIFNVLIGVTKFGNDAFNILNNIGSLL